MQLSKREHVALELLKTKNISVAEAYRLADQFVANGSGADQFVANGSGAEGSHVVFSYSTTILELSIRSNNILKAENIKTIGQLVTRSEGELLRTPHIGKRTLKELVDVLAVCELKLGMTEGDMIGFKPSNNNLIVKRAELYPHLIDMF